MEYNNIVDAYVGMNESVSNITEAKTSIADFEKEMSKALSKLAKSQQALIKKFSKQIDAFELKDAGHDNLRDYLDEVWGEDQDKGYDVMDTFIGR
jgi:phosphoserine phosphatase